jgi:hypothetical protein
MAAASRTGRRDRQEASVGETPPSSLPSGDRQGRRRNPRVSASWRPNGAGAPGTPSSTDATNAGELTAARLVPLRLSGHQTKEGAPDQMPSLYGSGAPLGSTMLHYPSRMGIQRLSERQCVPHSPKDDAAIALEVLKAPTLVFIFGARVDATNKGSGPKGSMS